MKDCYIGIDVGTSSCKTIAVDDRAVLLASAVRNYGLIQKKPGWNEQQPEAWWEAVCSAVSELTGKLNGYTPCAVSFSGQMHSMVALDEADTVVRPAILWNDQRTVQQCETILQRAGGSDALRMHTNNAMLTGYTGGKILWMQENEPEHYGRTKTVIMPKDYVRYCMTGEIATDASDASGTGLFDVKNGRWAEELIQKVQIDRSLFPEVLQSVSFAGRVTRAAAERTNLPEGTPVFAGGGDAVLSAIGMGVADSRRIGVTLGTSGVVATAFSRMPDNKDSKLQIFCGNTARSWVSFGCTLSAAGSLQWLKDTLFPHKTFQQINEAAAAVPDGSDGLLFLPYLNGERCPYFDAAARGGFLGLSGMSGEGHIIRSVMEGVAFSQKQVYQIVAEGMSQAPKEIIAAGGGAKSALWRQILANVFQLPVKTVIGSEEGGAFAAALIAMIGSGHFANAAEAASVFQVATITQPTETAAQVLEQAYEKYKKMYDALAWSFV